MQQTERIPHPSSPPPPPSAQVLLNRYRVLEVNTSGGFGTVKVCWDARLQRRVAIKQMPLHVGSHSPESASTMSEALAEARTSSMLQHPNIVTMFDFERDDDYSYLVMEYVDGMNLADFLARVEGGVLTYDECAHLIDSVASALAYAHENGVLHLDIKPANIMVDRSGTVKLADFGMASLASAAGYGGARGGTVGYMPPEQIVGDLVDERCDVFSLAVVVWQALTGTCPFAARTPEQSLDLINKGPSVPLSKIEPELAGRVEDTLMQALEPDPAHRTASIEDFARNLVFALGDTREGASSLHDLLNQAEPDEEPDPAEDWERLHVPISSRVPWLTQVSTRVLACVTAAWMAWRLLPYAIFSSQGTLAIITCVVAAICAVWPPLTGACGIALIVAAIASTPTSISMALALFTGILGTAWWVLAGRRSYLSGPALLAGCCLGSSVAGSCLCAFSLSPACAFFTGTGGYLLCLLHDLGISCAFNADALIDLLHLAALDYSTWILALLCGGASLVGALISRKKRVAQRIAGQVVTCLALVAAYILVLRMENSSIGNALGAPALVIALSLGATLCIISAFMGNGDQNQESDERI